jgi:hypothetical protein
VRGRRKAPQHSGRACPQTPDAVSNAPPWHGSLIVQRVQGRAGKIHGPWGKIGVRMSPAVGLSNRDDGVFTSARLPTGGAFCIRTSVPSRMFALSRPPFGEVLAILPSRTAQSRIDSRDISAWRQEDRPGTAAGFRFSTQPHNHRGRIFRA